MLDYDCKTSSNKSIRHYKIPLLKPCSNLFKLYSSLIAMEEGGGESHQTDEHKKRRTNSGEKWFLSTFIINYPSFFFI